MAAKAIVFWDVTLDSLVEIWVPFGGTWYLYLQGGYFENFYHITRRHIPHYGSFQAKNDEVEKKYKRK